eukprot:1064170-Karenia_brevis.AAC.1
MGQQEFRRFFRDHGWQIFWGKPQPPQVRWDENFEPSPWNAAHGGVGIMVRAGYAAQLGPIDSEVRQ